MTRRSFTVLVIALTILVPSVPSAANAAPPLPSYWFEVEFKHLANDNERRGFVIDAAGRVCTFDLGHEVWAPADLESFTEDELVAKYAHKQKCGPKMDDATFLKYKALIHGATEGKVARTEPACTDSGTLAFRAFVFSTMNRRYRPVMLAIGGDTVKTNSSPEAAELVLWLKSLKKPYAKPPCKTKAAN